MRALLLIVVLAAVIAPAAATANRTSHVRLLTFSPLLVRGTGFMAHEKVVVTIEAGTTTAVARVSSSATGGFMAHFARTLPARQCALQIVVTAVGSHGDRAVTKTPPPMCGALLGP